MTLFLEGSISELTHDGYKRFWAMWVGFLVEWRGMDDVALWELGTPIEEARVVLLFVVYLYTDCDRREKECDHEEGEAGLQEKHGRGERPAGRSRGECRHPFLSADRDCQAGEGLGQDAVGLRGHPQQCHVDHHRARDRPWLSRRKAKDHTLRSSRVIFLLRGGEVAKAVSRARTWRGSESSWAPARRGQSCDEGRFCRGHRVARTGKDPGMRDRTVFAEELHSVIKAGCADFDLPVEVFGSKPMRKTMATNDRLKGVGREEANEKGKGSTCTRHYSHARAARAEGAVGGGRPGPDPR